MAPPGIKLNSWRVHRDISSPGCPLKGPCLGPSQHSGCQGHRGAPWALWQGEICHLVLPGSGKDPNPAQEHPGDLVALSHHHPAQQDGAETCSVMLCLSRCHQTCWMELPPPADPWDAEPVLGPEHHPSTLPALCNGVTPQPSLAQNGSSLPPSMESSCHQCPGDTTGSFPSLKLYLPSCAALHRSDQKTSPNHRWGNNVLASSQAMGNPLISTIPSPSHPPRSLEASPTSISPETTWLQESKSPPSSLSLRGPLWYPQIQQCAGNLESVTWPRGCSGLGDKVEQGRRSEHREALPATQEVPARQWPGARDGAERAGEKVQHVGMLSREEEEGYEGT